MKTICISDNISLNSFKNEKMCQAKFVENLKIHVLCAVTFPPLHSEICAVYEIPWKNIVEQGSQQMTIQYGACPWHAG